MPAQAETVLGLLDVLGLDDVAVVGHDQGGAVAEVIAARHPPRITRLVLADAEAYDNWPSAEELPFVRATQLPVLGRLVLWAWSRRALASGKAAYDRSTLTDEVVDGYIAANLSARHRKTRRYLGLRLDKANQQTTARVVDGLRRFNRSTLIVWRAEDVHFAPLWGDRLYRDIPSATRQERLPGVGHLLMEDRLEQLAEFLDEFLSESVTGRKP